MIMIQNPAVRRVVFAGLCLLPVFPAIANGGKTPAAYHELLEASMTEKFGLEFYVKGQVIPGIVTAISDDGAVEVRNQRQDRVIIRLDRIDALGR